MTPTPRRTCDPESRTTRCAPAPTGRSDASATPTHRRRSTSSRIAGAVPNSRSNKDASPARPSDTTRTRSRARSATCRPVRPPAASSGPREVRRGRRVGAHRLEPIDRASEQTHARLRDQLDPRVLADFDAGPIRKTDLDASGAGSHAIAGKERHVEDRRRHLTLAFERRRALDKGDVRRRRDLLRAGEACRRHERQHDEIKRSLDRATNDRLGRHNRLNLRGQARLAFHSIAAPSGRRVTSQCC